MPVAATKALVKAAASGDPLPLPGFMSEIERRGGVARRGQLVMIAGVPNSGKSSLAQAITALANVPGIYFSADQSASQTVSKLISTFTGEDHRDVSGRLGDPAWMAHYQQQVLGQSQLQFCFDSNPSLESIALELDAYVETWDEYPEVIVVDTLLNVQGSGEKQDDQFIMSELYGLARRTNACVFVLVHQSRAGVKDSTKPVPIGSIINKLDALPDLVFMVAYDGPQKTFYVCVGKTREGEADPEAQRPIALGADFSTMQFTSQPVPQWGAWGNDYER